MPKQRRTMPARPAQKKTGAKSQAKVRRPAAPVARKPPRASAAARSASKRPARASQGDPKRRRAPVSPQKTPVGPSQRDLAVDVFERGFQALQQRDFDRAAERFTRVVNDYQDEKELQERARVYLAICERQRRGNAATPRSLEERINLATVAINRGAYGEGLALLRKLEPDHRNNDHLQYLLCVAHAVLGDAGQALEHLKLAVALNSENRYLASRDTDLESLRGESGFAAALETPRMQPPGQDPAKGPSPAKPPASTRAAARKR